MGWRLAKCPSCGGSLNVETDRNVIFCQYCGAKLQKTDDRIVIEHVERKIDETENRRIAFEEKKFSSSDKSRHRTRFLALLLLIGGIASMAIPGLSFADGMGGPFILMIAAWLGFASMKPFNE